MCILLKSTSWNLIKKQTTDGQRERESEWVSEKCTKYYKLVSCQHVYIAKASDLFVFAIAIAICIMHGFLMYRNT